YPLTTTLTGDILQTEPVTLDMLGGDVYQGIEHQALPSLPASPGVAGTIALYHEAMADYDRFGLITEFGGDVVGIPATTQPLHLHNGLWGGMGTGATVAPLLWSDGGDYPLLTNATSGQAMRDELERVAAFQALLAAAGNGIDGATLTPAIMAPVGSWQAFRANDDARGCAWIMQLDGTSLPAAQSLTVPAMRAGTYTITWFDTERASTVTETTSIVLGSAGDLIIPFGDFANTRPDAAVIFARQPPGAIIALPSGSG
ncbi:MAG: hypothetical protein H0X45_15110, partial [Planctomycetes bacterium]|nr:hypothetical protein [Planctomycetota bacterium]